jgi:tetratricopeptide (TPR) repeat protein
MAKPKANSKSQSLGTYFLPMLLSAAVGSGLTWAIMSQRSPSGNPPAPFTTSDNKGPVAANTSAPSTAEAAVIRGNQAYDHHQWADAIREYQDAIAKGLDNPDVRTDLGNAFRFSEQPGKALEQYAIAQRQNPQHENSLFNQIGLFMDVMHDPIRAVPVCEDFIKRFPTSDKVPRVQEQLEIAKNL